MARRILSISASSAVAHAFALVHHRLGASVGRLSALIGGGGNALASRYERNNQYLTAAEMAASPSARRAAHACM